jgi:hypothetical protein
MVLKLLKAWCGMVFVDEVRLESSIFQELNILVIKAAFGKTRRIKEAASQ